MIDNRNEMAIFFLCRLSVLEKKELLRLSSISNETGFSISYLEAMAKQLREAEYIESHRGPKGGYRLKKHVGDIYLADVFDAVKFNDRRRLADEPTSIILDRITKEMIGKLTLFSVTCRLPEGWKK